jgi:endoglucanase
MKRTILALVIVGLLVGALPTAAQPDGVSDARFARLARGINLQGWFWYGPGTVEATAEHYLPGDFAFIRDLGFTHVRIPIDLGTIMDADSPNLLRADMLAVLDAGIAMANAADLAVIVDLHSTSMDAADDAVYSADLEDDPAFVALFLSFWESFAAHLSATDPEMVFLEPMNEPVYEDRADDWAALQIELIAAIRAQAPDHTILATGTLWSNLDTLLELEPLDDPNIVYNFHFYEPFLFTHQGADWSWDAVRMMREVPYPSSPALVQKALDRSPDHVAEHIVQYGVEAWDADRINTALARAEAWAAEHGVRVTCNEFGAYREYAPADDRVRWTHDVRTAFEAHDIGWTMWEYDGGFGLVQRIGRLTIIDAALGEALGLNIPDDISAETR